MYTRILATTGGSPWSDMALAYAQELAGRLGAELRILTALVLPGDDGDAAAEPPSCQARTDLEKAAQELLDEAAKQARQAGVATVTHAVWGAVPETILQTASAQGCDLIVMGTRRREAAEPQKLGRITRMVAANAPQSVLVVKGPFARRGLVGRRLLVAAGHTSWSKYAVEHAIGLAQVLDLEVCVFHVAEAPSPDGADIEMEGQQLLAQAEAWANVAGVPYQGVLSSAQSAPEAILRAAEAQSCRAIVLGTRSVEGWHRLALGSIVNAVAARAALPVLIVKPDMSV
jgi:nucleotide-binding universal stress UspA family protein